MFLLNFVYSKVRFGPVSFWAGSFLTLGPFQFKYSSFSDPFNFYEVTVVFCLPGSTFFLFSAFDSFTFVSSSFLFGWQRPNLITGLGG